MFTWTDPGVGIGFDLLRESHDGLKGEITICKIEPGNPNGARPLFTWGLFNLSAPETRSRMAGNLAERTHYGTRDLWAEYLEYSCFQTATLYRRGTPTVRLRDVVEHSQVEYMVEKLLPLGQTSIIYGRGGGGKGWITTALAIAVSSGIDWAGLKVDVSAPVLYLDWEMEESEARRRLGWLARGWGLRELPDALYYRRMDRPLVDEAHALRAEIGRLGIGFVIVDSIVPAIGDDPRDADQARQVMNVLRTFGPATRLALGHMTKQDSRSGSGEGSIFGSVFFENLGRSVWEMRGTEPSGAAVQLGLYHRKVNLGAHQAPIGLSLIWEDDRQTARLTASAVDQEPDLAQYASLRWRILKALRRGALTTSELAEETHAKPNNVRAECNRMNEVVNLKAGAKGKDTEARWGLIEKRE